MVLNFFNLVTYELMSSPIPSEIFTFDKTYWCLNDFLSLSIVDCNREDTGRYQLEASNSCGSAKLGFGVNVVSKYFIFFDFSW